ncbi:orotidine-5-phosphate decarboxylase/orotate phosphoribosyltransferase [Toxoplasma gondii TgCatPRC2]|uniref:Orotidine 5'-phosphate decarboxylase n=12 Tax=Toxoplasma gondii TaxID=5811 RepID=B6KBH9_TOXGV|nr:orotidine-5-phosphate decarboxylase/orotate phosphoribosyltransferase [Toxoplasma gondii ME49]ESS32001.1 orotidine-5-phosphate decarboxylase/orotate phosphoribosyltransferase [Toxoplasma gondii VEG]KFG34045.1 orotidine-5-phosphate decarboxylase/orotate phosphoribosyltransferase [Toxoplasma gondii GAB2-2007-GAL-DOM2]KFG40203.1 orotidine-5-phosphate decarboxylase/orotate phosphoribosyltransferase [Toxoplasma gondii p89]KFG40702.1 orotidine-5-phosphate decarboxylase/orotate phosphoribosyltransf|eukprot:XP_002365163.1 orotidine-5-phosphate decarboxylase/orotate phosphoribosyltransferase [Toxoplasma gondii ME49]
MPADALREKPVVQAAVNTSEGCKNFFKTLDARIEAVDSLLTVGLDPHIADLPSPATAERAFVFCERIIRETLPFTCCYKPNSAFFEAFGPPGLQALERVCALIPDDVPILLDAKRGDIGSTAQAYASSAFDAFKADGVTVNAYMGREAVRPFLSYRNKGVFVLVKTSNQSSNEFQTLPVRVESSSDTQDVPLYVQMARVCNELAQECVSEEDSPSTTGHGLRHNASGGGVGLVVGATDIEALREVRKACPDLYILAPGVGAQGADLERALSAGLCKDGKGMLIPVSRGISRAENLAAQANAYREQINEVRRGIVQQYEES